MITIACPTREIKSLFSDRLKKAQFVSKMASSLQLESDVCVVITGKLEAQFIEPLIETYRLEDPKNKLVSTWNDQPTEFVEYLRKNGFMVIQGEYPSHVTSANLQATSIHRGLVKAKDHGFKYAMRMRTDVACKGDTFQTLKRIVCSHTLALQSQKLTILCGIEYNPQLRYYYDVLFASNLETMMKFFGVQQTPDDSRYVEKYWVETYSGKTNLTRDDLKEVFDFCLGDCRREGIQMSWLSKGYDIIRGYCGGYYIWI